MSGLTCLTCCCDGQGNRHGCEVQLLRDSRREFAATVCVQMHGWLGAALRNTFANCVTTVTISRHAPRVNGMQRCRNVRASTPHETAEQCYDQGCALARMETG